jgi:hypothetical protein
MSVNAINAADQQPQRKSSPIVPSLVAGTVLGGAGYAGGHYFGGTRPDLDKVFAMTDDQFTKSTKDSLEGATDAQKTDLETIKSARAEYAKAGETEKGIVREKGKAVADLIKGQSPENAELATNLTKAQNEFNAIGKVKITNHEGKEVEVTRQQVMDELKNAKEELKNATGDAKTAAETRVANAKKNAQAYFNHPDVKPKNEALRNAKEAMNKAKIAKFEAEAAKEGDNGAKAAKTALETAKSDYTKAKTNALNTIKERQGVKDAFESVKKLFAKEGKGKTAWIAAGIAAAVGLIGGFILGGSKNDVA